jgi:hypothetical protein
MLQAPPQYFYRIYTFNFLEKDLGLKSETRSGLVNGKFLEYRFFFQKKSVFNKFSVY